MANTTNPITAAISSASSTLKDSFGNGTKVEGEEQFRYLEIDTLTDLYLTELNEKDLTVFLSDIPGSITKMRSSYLPTELVNQFAQSFGLSLSEVVVDSSAIKESYENAFMRMMGLPQSSALEAAQNIIVVSCRGEKFEVSYEILESEVLDERQAVYLDRKIKINGKIYNFDNDDYENESFNEQEIELTDDQDPLTFISSNELEIELNDCGEPNMANIEDELFRYKYLLIPPVQDSRVSQCINEPSKIVAPNFSNPRGHNINSREIRTSMLESVIRIRRDRLSGRNFSSSIDVDGEEEEIRSDDYGVLESLFIIRIRSALKAMARKIGEDIDVLRELYEQTGKIPVVRDFDQAPANAPDPGRSETLADKKEKSEQTSKPLSLLEKQKVIEDSMMALLDDNSEVLDLQLQTQRNSSIKSSHVMSSLIGIIDLPRQRIKSKLDQEESSTEVVTNGAGDQKRTEIDMIIGTKKGVGAIDILVYILALFTMPEDYLVSLLSDNEYNRYLEEFAGAADTGSIVLFEGTGNADSADKPFETSVAVNKMTEYIISGYNLFVEDLGNSDSGHGAD